MTDGTLSGVGVTYQEVQRESQSELSALVPKKLVSDQFVFVQMRRGLARQLS